MRPSPNIHQLGIMPLPDNRNHNLSAVHNWALLGKIIINLCISHGAAINQRKHNLSHSHSLSLSPASSAPSFMALKRCNNRGVLEPWWAVFTPAAQSTSRRCGHGWPTLRRKELSSCPLSVSLGGALYSSMYQTDSLTHPRFCLVTEDGRDLLSGQLLSTCTADKAASKRDNMITLQQ